MNELEQYRKEIACIDEELVSLFAKRFSLVEKVGEYKEKNGLSVFQESQWEKVLKIAIERGEKQGLSAEFIEQIWKTIHKQALFLQYKQKGMLISPNIDTEE